MNNDETDRNYSGQQKSDRQTEESINITGTEVTRKEMKKDQLTGKNKPVAERPRKSFHNDGPGGNYKGY